jgi:hypothetical protein
MHWRTRQAVNGSLRFSRTRCDGRPALLSEARAESACIETRSNNQSKYRPSGQDEVVVVQRAGVERRMLRNVAGC